MRGKKKKKKKWLPAICCLSLPPATAAPDIWKLEFFLFLYLPQMFFLSQVFVFRIQRLPVGQEAFRKQIRSPLFIELRPWPLSLLLRRSNHKLQSGCWVELPALQRKPGVCANIFLPPGCPSGKATPMLIPYFMFHLLSHFFLIAAVVSG